MRVLAMTAVLALGAGGAPAAAADFISGTYSTAEGCAALAEGGADSEEGASALVLTSKGLAGYEISCEFVNVYARAELPGWVAVAFCEEPGLSSPELFSIMPLDSERLQVSTPSFSEAEGGLGGEYQRCNISE
jgi:hypothetical protein